MIINTLLDHFPFDINHVDDDHIDYDQINRKQDESCIKVVILSYNFSRFLLNSEIKYTDVNSLLIVALSVPLTAGSTSMQTITSILDKLVQYFCVDLTYSEHTLEHVDVGLHESFVQEELQKLFKLN